MQTIKLSDRSRRNLARRLYKQQPITAFEIMRTKVNPYSYDDFTNDLVQKVTKRKPKKQHKNTGFDWQLVLELAPDFFYKCKKRTPHVALIHALYRGIIYEVYIYREVYDKDAHGFTNWLSINTNSLIHLASSKSLVELSRHPNVSVCLPESIDFGLFSYVYPAIHPQA